MEMCWQVLLWTRASIIQLKEISIWFLMKESKEPLVPVTIMFFGMIATSMLMILKFFPTISVISTPDALGK